MLTDLQLKSHRHVPCRGHAAESDTGRATARKREKFAALAASQARWLLLKVKPPALCA